jgi:hypothetical protein
MSNLARYLDKALVQAKQVGASIFEKEEDSRLAGLLNDIVQVDEPKVLAIAQAVKYKGAFSELVRDNVKDMNFSDRYNDITEKFTSIREDTKGMVRFLDDGKISLSEKIQMAYIRLVRGTIPSRFDDIKEKYEAVADDTQKSIQAEQVIIDAYMNFRFAMKEAEIMAFDVKKKQEGHLETAKTSFNAAQAAVDAYTGSDEAERSRLQLTRDVARGTMQKEDARYQLIKDVAEEMQIGYNVGETLMGALSQSHGIKEQLYRRAVTFFENNEHVFTTMAALYVSQKGVHEASETLGALKDGVDKGLEDLAEVTGTVNRKAVERAYGKSISSESLQKLVDSIVSFEADSLKLIGEYRKEATENANRAQEYVEAGKKRFAEIAANYATSNTTAQ